MKVIVVGAGLSGLGTAIALRRYVKDKVDIKIYDRADAHDTGLYGWSDHADLRLKNQGAAISLQANALRVLKDLDPELAANVRASGFPCKGFTWKTAGNYWLGREHVDLLPISRPVLVQCLQKALPADVAVQYRAISKVEIGTAQKPRLHFEDGATEEADLVVGADGIRSLTRQALFGEDEKYQPNYLGHCAVGGVLDRKVSLPQSYLDDPTIMFYEGPNGFFGYSGLSQADPTRILYFSIYDSPLPDRHKLDYNLINQELRERHSDFADPMIGQCLGEAQVDNVYPICWLPDLPYWGRNGVVLVGDAAHAMTPASGQGGSQAFEDAQTLALLLAGYLEKHSTTEATEHTITGLYNVRHRHVDELKAKGLSVKEPERPWSTLTTALVYVGLLVFVQVKNISGYLGMADPVRNWDSKREVAKYLGSS